MPIPSGPIKSFCIDFNWDVMGQPASPGLYTDVNPEQVIDWIADLGATTVQIFNVSFPGLAWYPSPTTPMNPGLPPDFLERQCRHAARRGLGVMGYLCLGGNRAWQTLQPAAETHAGIIGGRDGMPIPTTQKYLDYFCRLVREAAEQSDVDGVMIDWLHPTVHDHWLENEKDMWRELLGEDFPRSTPSAQAVLEFDRRAMARAWQQIHHAATSGSRRLLLWPNLFVRTPDDPLWREQTALREADWILNESPEQAYIAWLRSQMKPDGKLIQCAVGWASHRMAEQRAALADKVDGWYGFAIPHPISKRPWTREETTLLKSSWLASQDNGFAAGLIPNLENMAALRQFFHGNGSAGHSRSQVLLERTS